MEGDLDALDALFDANPDAAKGIAAAYDVLLGGVPTVAGFTFLINRLIVTNYGSNDPAVQFNEENIFINITNALVQGNDAAAERFEILAGGPTDLADQVAALYNALVPESVSSAEGLAFLTRPEALQFYRDVAADRGVAGEDGAAIVALASLLKILVHTDVGPGGEVNDFIASVDNGSAELPASGSAFTPIEDAIGLPDTVPPTVAITAASGQILPGQATIVTFDFSETVTGFELADITATGGTLSNLVQSGSDPSVYVATFTAGDVAGPASIQLVGSYQDDAGNPGASGAAALTIGEGNVAPLATPDSYGTTGNTALTVTPAAGVLANDTDANGDALTAELVTNVAHGALVLNADGSFTYTPTAGYAGPDSFAYRATDGEAAGNTVTVTLTVANSGVAAPASVDLGDIAGGFGGFRITGQTGGDRAGHSVSDVGDINGDGFADLIIGAFGNDVGGDSAGAAYVVFGSATPPASVDLDAIATGAGGFRIIGQDEGDLAGISVSSAGDINGDGFDDFIIGASLNNRDGAADAGAAYVVFGSATPPASIDLDAIAAGTGGFKISGENGVDQAGSSVSDVGDFNSDGFDDLIVGAFDNDAAGDSAGAAYVVFGSATSPTAVDLGAIPAGAGFRITGQDVFDNAGWSVSSAGDVNGDGFDDVVVGALNNDTPGAAYVVFGSAAPPASVDLDAIAAGTGGFKISGENAVDQAGFSVSSAGDVDGDGFGDLIVGAQLNDNGGDDAGAAYVVFGSATPVADVDLGAIPAGAGIKITGQQADDEAGFSVASAGDVDGDGFDDLVIGALNNDGFGAAYLVFGSATPPTSIDLDTIAAGNGGFRITGENTGDLAGRSVSGAGDINGDGFDDLIVGAPGNENGGSFAGAAYVIYGGDWMV
jgi:VCBS repeat-containing protein